MRVHQRTVTNTQKLGTVALPVALPTNFHPADGSVHEAPQVYLAIQVGRPKGRPAGDSFMFGAVLGPLGLLLVAVLPGPAPKGTRKVNCPRCNAQQNVPVKDQTFECWQCKQTSTAAQ